MAILDVRNSDHLRPQVGDDVTVERIQFPSRDPGRTITAYVYTPKDLPPGPSPVHVNVHGSGFTVYAFFGNSRWFCYKVASKLKCVVIDTDYRKAPEYPLPFQPRDIEDCVTWVQSQPKRFDLDMITMSGFSAGGNLCLSTANHLGPEVVKAVISYYAPIDATTPGASRGIRSHPEPKESSRSGVHLIPWVFATFFQSYIPLHLSPTDPRVSVLYLPIERYPDYILLCAGRCDVMFEDSNDFYKMVMAKGSEKQKANVEFVQVPGESHAFDELANCEESIKWRETAYDASIELIRKAHEEERGKRGKRAGRV